MKCNKLALAMGFGMVLAASAANAATVTDQGHGTVNFKGSIIDAACSITGDTSNQTVDLGQISKSALEANNSTGRSASVPFDIKLTNCDATGQTVKTTFSGAAGQVDGSLGIDGSASGASIVLTSGGVAVPLDSASTGVKIDGPNADLSFAAYLQGNGASAVIVPGDFTATTTFTLTYA